jgi:hypothetical protein
MNSTVVRPQDVTFRSVCKEVMEGTSVSVLCAEGVREYCPEKMADDFEMQHGLRPSKQRACFYSILEFQPSEQASDETLILIGKSFLDHMRIVDTQFVIAKRLDGSGLFLQIIANMVDNSGKTIKDSFIWIRADQAARKLTKAYFSAQNQRA